MMIYLERKEITKMPRRIAQSTLNASTLDILNVIRQNASYEYQSSVPEVTTATDIPRVGEIICGTPALANQFINALVNRIALVVVNSATFNNPYNILKKGYIEFGESVEEIFVNIAKVIEYTPEKGEDREFKRTLPDVRSIFHTMNWRVMYPVTIQDEDLRMAFLSMEGVQNLIAKITDSVYTAAEYDEFLLFKYLLIKGVSHGRMKPVSVGDGTDLKDSAVQFRGISNKLTFMSGDYNEYGVKTNTPKERQVIFMDSLFNAQFDVEVLAGAFNMDKADFMGRLFLIDDFTTFDNERFEVIRANSDGIEEVTATELAYFQNVKAIVLDENWFQVYDNMNKFTEKYVASGLYWNYFYHTWKTISYSPFANAVVFVDSSVSIEPSSSVTITVLSKDVRGDVTVFTLDDVDTTARVKQRTANFVQTEDATEDGIAVQKFGAVIFTDASQEYTVTFEMGGATYVGATALTPASDVGDTIVCAKQ